MTQVKAPSLPGSHNIQRVVLENGITLLSYENYAAQSVVIAGSLRAGSIYESPAQNGLASLTASALMRGTRKRDFNTLASAQEDVGADLNVGGGTHFVSFFGKALAEDLPLLVELLADVLREPAFPVQQVERLRGELMTGMRMRMQDTRFRASRAFSEALYPPEHPYHYSPRGTIETLTTITPDDLIAFHRQQYGPDGMLIAIVGAVSAAEAEAVVRQWLADWTNPAQVPTPELPALAARHGTERIFTPLAGKTQSDLILGIVGPARSAPDFMAAQVANSVLGQFGMMGRIGGSVREDLGLAYYAYSDIEGGLGPGAWKVAAGVNPANVDLAIERIVDELVRITSEPVSSDDLDDNQSYFVGRLPSQLESNEGIASNLLNMEVNQLGLDYLVNYREMLYRLTPGELLAAARRYLTPEALVISVSGPERA